jgi:hypothetical protein
MEKARHQTIPAELAFPRVCILAVVHPFIVVTVVRIVIEMVSNPVNHPSILPLIPVGGAQAFLN